MNITVKKLSELHPLEKNVRRHGEKQIAEYMRSLEAFKQIRPMVVDETGLILIGNGMYEAMLRLGWTHGDCYVVEGLTEHQKTKMILADNRLYELGFTDMDVFEELIRDLGDDLDVPGWDEDLLETITASSEEVDSMVENYGIYEPEEVSRANEHIREDHTALAGQEPALAPLQRPASGQEPDGPVPDSPMAETPSASAQAPEGRYIVCPHCGQRILLDGIGGM